MVCSMKKILASLLLLGLCLPLVAQQKTTPQGIHFFKGSLKEAFAFAQKQNKPLFVEIYAIGCHHCENFKKTFDANAAIGDFYDKNFVNYQLEVNSAEGMKFREKHNIYVVSTPLMTFWDKNENLLHIQTAGDEQNNQAYLLAMGRKALDPQQQSAAWKKHFQAGEQDPNFLIEYAYTCRMICDTVDNIAAMNRYVSLLTPERYNDAINFVLLQKVIMDDDNPLFLHLMQNLVTYQQKYGSEVVNSAAENIMMYSLFSSRSPRFSLEKFQQMRQNLRKIGIPEKSIQARLVWIESAVMFRTGHELEAAQLINSFCKGISDINKQDATYIESFVKSKTQNQEALALLDWIFKLKNK